MVLGLILLAVPAATAQPLGGSERLCEGPVDYDCTDYTVVCEDESIGFNCHKESNGHYCAVFTTIPADFTLPEHVGPFCRHETYGEPPVSG